MIKNIVVTTLLAFSMLTATAVSVEAAPVKIHAVRPKAAKPSKNRKAAKIKPLRPSPKAKTAKLKPLKRR